MLADLTLLAYVLLIVPGLLVGFFFARRKRFEPHHKLTMTTITLVNWVIILFVMVVSYTRNVAPQIPAGLSQAAYLLPTLHLITGALAQILATYLVILMWYEKALFGWLRTQKIKTPMRITLTLWLITAALGVIIYFTWYVASPTSPTVPEATTEATEVPAPVTTPEASGG